MPRKEMLRTKIKREILAAVPTAIAVEEARARIYKKTEKNKPVEVSLHEHLGRLIDRIDPLKAIAILGLTVSLKTIWDSSEELLKVWSETWKTAKIDNPKAVILHISAEYKRQLDLGKAAQLNLPFLDPNLDEMELLQWLVCFSVSFLIVEHPEILTMGTTAILRLFVGVA